MKLCDVPRLVNYFKNSDFVITDAFHGTVLSVIYNKKLIIIKDSNTTILFNRFDRFDTLFHLLEGDLNKAHFDNINTYLNKYPKFDFPKINYDIINKNILKKRKEAFSWIKSKI